MKRRILTGLPLAAAVVWLAIQPRQWVFLLALLATVEISLYEFFGICRKAGLGGWPWLGYFAGGLLCVYDSIKLCTRSLGMPVFLPLVVIAVPALGLFLASDLKGYAGALAATILGIFYVAFTLSWLVPLRFADTADGKYLILLLFAVIWLQDVAAYFVGRIAGRTPLASRISPKKTVEGAVAGLTAALAVGWVFAHWFWQTGDQKAVILVAGVVGVAGQVGDLAESALKRSADVKDSGTLLPGHGGLLDRIDSLVFGAPALWFMWNLMGLWRR